MKNFWVIALVGGLVACLLLFWAVVLLCAMSGRGELLVIPEASPGNSNSQWGEFAAALGGAFAGALAAYLLQVGHERKKTHNEEYQAIIIAQTILLLQHTRLTNFCRKRLEEYRADPQRHTKIKSLVGKQSNPVIDVSSLIFLMPDSPQEVLVAILRAQNQFTVAEQMIQVRYQSHKKQQECDDLTTPGGKKRDEQLKHDTDLLYKAFDSALLSCIEAFALLKSAAESRYDRKFLILPV